MVSISAGAGTLYHWMRNLRGRSRMGIPVNRDETRQALSGARPDLDRLIETVQRDGVAAVSNYWNSERCAGAAREIDRLLTEQPGSVKVYSNGSDKRMFGVESASAVLMENHADPFARRFAELMGGLDIYNFATLGARITATEGNNGSGDGWHRDAAGFQFKAILYLTDTSLDSGPFQYLIGSHTMWRAAADSMVAGISDPRKTRLTEAEIQLLTARGAEARAFPAEAGTLLLVNSAGIHRGMPLKTGARYALTNYYYHRFEIDEERIAQFNPLVPGTAERIRRDLF